MTSRGRFAHHVPNGSHGSLEENGQEGKDGSTWSWGPSQLWVYTDLSSVDFRTASSSFLPSGPSRIGEDGGGSHRSSPPGAAPGQG